MEELDLIDLLRDSYYETVIDGTIVAIDELKMKEYRNYKIEKSLIL